MQMHRLIGAFQSAGRKEQLHLRAGQEQASQSFVLCTEEPICLIDKSFSRYVLERQVELAEAGRFLKSIPNIAAPDARNLHER